MYYISNELMNTNIEFDEIFALRVLLQDEYENENDIIREIKYELLSRGMLEENIPAFIQEFYEKFGINITLEQINEALINPNQGLENQLLQFVNSFLQNQMNGGIVNNNSHIHPESASEGDEDSEPPYDDDEDIDDDEQHEQQDEQQDQQQEGQQNLVLSNNQFNAITSQLQQVVLTMSSGPTGMSYQVATSNLPSGLNGPASNNVSVIPEGPVAINPPGTGVHPLPVNPLENLLNSLLNVNGPQMQLPSIHPMMLQPLLPPLVAPLNIVGNPGAFGMQDVRTTLDEDDTDNLKKYKLESKLEEKCSICMTDMDVGNEACELPCNHNFHSECIEPWLKQYNYKCPICRKEAGKPKYNV